MSEQPVDEVVMVPNPYLAALRDKRTESLPHLYELRTALDDAVSAMDQGAWQHDGRRFLRRAHRAVDHPDRSKGQRRGHLR
ncbi:hypothetical protein BH24ACT8_BH24ACT8_13920 [soil metagenome]